MVETKNQLHEFRNENGASLRRITPSTQVGRLSGSHSDIGFQLAQFPSWEGRWGKRKVKRSAQLKCWTNVELSDRNLARPAATHERLRTAVGNLFVGEYREEGPWNQRTAAGWTIGVSVLKAGTFSRRPSRISWRTAGASLDQAKPNVPDPPALKSDLVVNSPSGQGLTHTRCRFAALVRTTWIGT